MTNLKKKTLITVLSIILVVSAVMCFSVKKESYALSPKDVISAQNNVTVSLDQTAPNGLDGELKGVKITVDGNAGSVNFNNRKGPFALKIRPLTSTNGVAEVSEIRFDFINKNNPREDFYAVFAPSTSEYNSVVTHKVKTSVFYKETENLYTLFQVSSNKNGGDTSILALSGTTFIGEGKPFEVSFNPYDMKFTFGNGVKTNEIVDFDNADSMKKNFATKTTLSRIDEYDVKMTIFAAGEKPASVIIYDYNAQSLAGQEFSNNVGPTLDSRINNTKGVKGYAYDLKIDDLKMYDVIDDYTDFNGSIEIVAPNGSLVSHNNGVFTPDMSGVYSVKYTPVDKDGVYGQEFINKITVLDKYPDADFNFHYPISSDLVFNNKVTLPSATYVSELAGVYDKELTVGAKIFANDSVIFEQKDTSSDFTVDVSGKTDLSVRYYVKDYLGNEKTSITYKFKNNGVSANVQTVQSEMLCGSHIIVGTPSLNGEELSHEIISPLGNVSTYKKVLLDTIGQWKVNYYYTLNNVKYTYTQYFDCVEKPSSLFISSRGMTLTDYVRSPEYSDVDTTGLLAESTISYSALTYRNNISVSGYTINDKLIEFLFTPDAKGSNEVKEAAVILEDPYNASNNITIKFQLEPYYSYHTLVAEIQVGDNVMKLDNGKPRKFYLGHSTFFGKYYGSTGTTKFSNPVSITLDYDQKILYIYNDYEYVGYNYVAGYDNNEKPITKTHIGIDLDNETMLGKGNGWKGFTTGETKLQFVYTKLTQTAHTLILAVDNMSLCDNVVNDTSAPGLVIDCDYDNLPTAKVGKAFPLMNAYAMDSIDGRIEDISINVYKLTSSVNRKIDVSIDKTFTPQSAGNYKIVYSAKDSMGNVGTKEIVIEAYDQLPDLDVDINIENSYKGSLCQGEKFILRSANGIGGSGKVNVEISVLYNGAPVKVNGVYVIAEKVGLYQVVYTLKDYLGTTRTITKDIVVERSDAPIFMDIVVPQAVIANRNYSVPERSATWYDAQGEQHTSVCTVKINGQDYTEKTYKPTENFTLQYFANGYGSEIITVKVLTLEKSKPYYLTGYFSLGNGVSVDKENTANQYLTFTIENDSNIFFGNALGADNVRIKFLLDSQTNSIGKINFVFTDTINANEKIIITTQKSPETTKETGLVSVNGGYQYDLLDSNYNALTAFGIDIGIKGNKVIGANGVELITIETTVDGAAFNGFSSGKVYLDIQFEDVESSSEFYLKTINNQTMSLGIDADKTAPEITLYDEFVPTAEYGVAYKFGDMQAFDTLDDVVTTYMKITAPSGDVVYDDILTPNYQFVPQEYGVYTVLVEFHDSNYKWNFYNNTITVRNSKIPEITYSGEIDIKYSIGGTIKLPTVSVESDITLFVSILEPTGIVVNLTDKTEYTFSSAGIYRLMYYACNADGAYKLDIYDITVD